MRTRIFSKIFLGLVVMSSVVLAQSNLASIVGSAVDTNGAAIPQAVITVTNDRTGEHRSSTTSIDGSFSVPNLAPSTYTIQVVASGFEEFSTKGLVLTAGQQRNLSIKLDVATMVQSVDVVSEGLVAVDTSSARIGANINEREVATLPLNGRQMSQLYLMTPGAVTAGGGSYDNVRFSGRANQQNAIRIDGVEASSIIDSSPGNLNGETSSGFRLQNSLETVQEFRVDSSNYPAEYGTGTGGQISVVTKSGSNQFHGSLFHYLRNSSLDSRNFFDGGDKSPLRLNQFGGSLGGPIVRNKAFFFVSYEGLRQRAGLNFIETVPSQSARARAVASIQPLLAAYPLGTQATANPDLSLAQLNASAQVDENFGSIRLDYQISDKLNASLRYQRDQGASVEPLGVTGNELRVTGVPQNASLRLQWIPSPSVVNEFSLGVNDDKTRGSGWAPSIPGVDLSAISVNYTGSVALSGIGGQGASASAATPGGLIRANSATNGRGQPYTNYTVSFIDGLTYVRGTHTFKFGGEVRPVRLYTDRLGGTTYTFNSINDLLANNPSQISFLGDVSAPSPFNNGVTGNRLGKTAFYIGYAQDEWRIRSNITLNYGLRYEYYSVMHEAQNRDVVFDTVQGRILPSDTPFFHSSKNNWGPRLGISWAPGKLNNKTVLRVGAGYYYGPGQLEDQIQPIESDRVSQVLKGVAYPIDPQQIIAGYNINDPNLGFQPRAYAPGYTVPERVLSYTASIQQQLPGETVLTVAYVGSQGRNLFLRSWTNLLTDVGMDPVTGVAIPVYQFGNRFAQIDYKTSGGTDHYDSLQTTLNRRFSRGLSSGLQWTYGHSIGDSGGSNEAQTSQDPYNLRGDRGNNNFDVRHSMNANVLYQLPFGPGRAHLNQGGLGGALLGGWEIGSVVNARTGLPLDIKITRPDILYLDQRTQTYVSSPIVVGGQVVTVPVINTPGGGAFRNVRRPDLVAGVDPFITGADKRVYLNPAAFSTPAPGSYGNLARNALHGPSLVQLDATVHRDFRVGEKMKLEFRAEIYNIFNKANFLSPPSVLPSAVGVGGKQLQPGEAFSAATAGNFGLLNSTMAKTIGLGASRQIQLSLRLNF